MLASFAIASPTIDARHAHLQILACSKVIEARGQRRIGELWPKYLCSMTARHAGMANRQTMEFA